MLVAGLLAGVLSLAVWLIFTRIPLPLDRLSVRQRQIVMAVYLSLVIGGSVAFGLAFLSWIAPLFQVFFEKVTVAYEFLLRVCLRCALRGSVAAGRRGAAGLAGGAQHRARVVPRSGRQRVHHSHTGRGRTARRGDRSLVEQIEQMVREVVPKEDLDMILANIGIYARWSAIFTPNNGPHAAFLRVQLRSGFAGRRTPTRLYVQELRDRLKDRFPTHDFFFDDQRHDSADPQHRRQRADRGAGLRTRQPPAPAGRPENSTK